MPPTDQRSTDIRSAYNMYLGRSASDDEVNTWYHTNGDPIDDIRSSQEGQNYARPQIAKAYKDYLGRDIEPGMLENRLRNLGGRAASDQIFDIQHSEEARSPNAASRLLSINDQNAKSPVDMYNESLEKLGIGDARTRVTSLREQLMNTESLLRNVEGDVSARTQDALVSENQRRKLVAGEQAPIANQLQILGENFDVAHDDYGMILDEAGKETNMGMEGQAIKRQALLDKLKFAIDSAANEEDKRRWQAEYNRIIAQDDLQARQWDSEFRQRQGEFDLTSAENRRQFDVSAALDRERLSKASASSASRGGGGGGRASGGRSYGGGSSGSRSSGGGLSYNDVQNAFLSDMDAQWARRGGAGSYGASRQEQDAWANAWFAEMGITDPADRQPLWNAYNSKYNRPANPYEDWLYAR